MPRNNPPAAATSRLRIIGGSWRGRKLPFPSVPGLRPTPDRVRETLFNWLQGEIHGAWCLDLFAGSGALGMEALSRGAGGAVFVERDAQAARALRENLATVGARRADVLQSDADSYLAAPPPRRFDVVFLDPPYADQRLRACLERLTAGDWLAPRAAVYMELSARDEPPALPEGWQLARDKTAGEVRYRLLRCP